MLSFTSDHQDRDDNAGANVYHTPHRMSLVNVCGPPLFCGRHFVAAVVGNAK